ncbi:hypothetical protein BDV12DRAFT_194766 [Aspergillus spectabilis]
MASILRTANDTNLRTTTPLIIYSIFVAARFAIISQQTIGQPESGTISQDINTILHALGLLSERWLLASQGLGTLPAEFWDVQYLALDIAEALRRWCVSDGEGL